MKAIAVFPKDRDIRLIECDPPKILSATGVKLRMKEIGVCGTDREICSFQYGIPPAGSDYLIPGHESLGEVVEVASDVSGLEVGDLAVLMVRRPCIEETCLACRSGRQDFCYTGNFTERGIKGAHGYLAEYVVEDEAYVIGVPHELAEIAVLIEPLTIAEKALAQVAIVQDRLPWECQHQHEHLQKYRDDRVQGSPLPKNTIPIQPFPQKHYHKAVVLGAGPVGLLGAMALITAGFETYVYSRESASDTKAELVHAIGGIYLSSSTNSLEQLSHQIGQIDLIYEATGASKISFEMINVLGTNAIFVFTGVPGRKAPIEVDTDLLMRNMVLKNQVILGTVNAGREAFEAALRDLTIFNHRWSAATHSLITHRFPLSEAPRVLREEPAGIKTIITLD